MKVLYFLLIIYSLLILSCHNKTTKDLKNEVTNCDSDSTLIEKEFHLGKEITIRGGDHIYFVKMLGNDSLFINVVRTFYMRESIYFTKGNNVKRISWCTGGKNPHMITNIQTKCQEE